MHEISYFDCVLTH